MATYRTGGEIDAACNKCKLTLAHTILAMVGDKVIRVQCNTCGSQHNYRGTQPSTGSTTSKARATTGAAKPRAPRASTSPAAVSRVTVSYEQLLADKGTSGARRYSPKDTYAQDEVIEHPSFGYGIVMEVRGDKVSVLFKMDEKTLVHGRGGAPAQRPAFHAPRAQSQAASDTPPAPEAEVSAQPEGEPAASDTEPTANGEEA